MTAAMVVVPPLGATAAHAATVHWDIDGATLGSGPDDTPDGTWAPQNAFWTADSNGLGPHAAWVSGDTANFSASSDATGAFTVTISGSQTAGGLTFQEGTVTLGGGTLNLNGAATVNVLILRSATINSVITGSAGLHKTGPGTLTLGGANTFTGGVIIDGGGGLSISADARLGAGSNNVTIGNGGDLLTTATFASSRVFTMGTSGGFIAPAAGTTLTINSALGAGANPMTMSGQGTLMLASASARTGDTTISSGTISVADAAALGTAAGGSVTINNGGTLNLLSNGIDKPITLNNGGTLRSSVGIVGSLGTITVASGADVTLEGAGGVLTVGDAANALTGGGGGSTITVAGNNFVDLFQDSNYLGSWIVTGLIRMDADASLGNAANGVTLDDGRVVTTAALSSARPFTLGPGGGTLQIESTPGMTVSGVISGNGPLAKTSFGTLTLGGANTFTGPITVNGGALSIDADARLGNAANDVTLNGGTLTATGTTTLGAGRGFTLGASNGTFSVAAASTLTVAGTVTGAGALTKTGAGTLVLNGPNNYSGGTTVNAGILRVVAGDGLPDNGPLTLANAASAAVEINGGTQFVGALSGGGASGGNITLANDARLSLSQTTTTTFAGTITGNGELTKGGTGTIVFTRQVAPADGINIAQGTLRLGASNILDCAVQLGTSAAFDLNGNTETINGLSGQGTVTLGSGALTAAVDSSSTYAGVISGSGSLTKAGVAALTLSGNHTYTGVTTVSAGMLVFNASYTTGAGLDVADGAVARVAASGAPAAAKRVLKTKSLNTHASGKLEMNDNDLLIDYTGDSVEGAIRQLVKNGRASGIGITSTPGTPDDDKVLAVADNANLNRTSWLGVNIDTSTVIGKYTFFGDANLDGKVTGDDYLNVDANLGTGDSWLEGDFNMSGTTTGDDYLAIDANLGKGTVDPLAFAELKAEMVALHAAIFGEEYLVKLAAAEAEGFGASVVPEPAGAVLLAVGVGLLARSRRRRVPRQCAETGKRSGDNHNSDSATSDVPVSFDAA